MAARTAITAALLLCLCSLSAQHRKYFERNPYYKYEPSVEIGRVMLPGLLGFVGGAMRTDTQRGRAVQVTLFFGAGVSVGCWKGRKPKHVLMSVGSLLVGTAVGYATRPVKN